MQAYYQDDLRAPFPYFGGKATVAADVWSALGQPKTYLEPFFGSGAVLLSRPGYIAGQHIESVCDKDGFLANCWRALQFAPDDVARQCDWPVNHADLSSRRRALLANEARLLENLNADPEWYDAKLAGYWVWAASCWIGSGLTRLGSRPEVGGSGKGVHALGKRPHVSHGGMGVHALGQRPDVANGGKGVHALGKRPHVANGGKGVQEPYNTNIYQWFRRLSERLRYVRVVCGDWTRICGGDWQDKVGDVGIFLDPPYGIENRDTELYHHDSTTIARDVADWALERGSRPSYRIVLAGYYEEHERLLAHNWRVKRWKATGGYSSQARQANANRTREALFYSPHCVEMQRELWSVADEKPTEIAQCLHL